MAELAIRQQLFLREVHNGKNIFLTGKAGTGKSYVLKQAKKELEKSGKKVIALAPTGIAANNIGGQTIHSMFNLPIHGVICYETVNFLKGEKRRMLDAIDVIIIDEVSMVRADMLDGINLTLVKNGCKSLASKQIIFVGDMKQLEAVVDDNTRSVMYRTYNGIEFFEARCYEKLHVQNIILDEIQRQSDPEFIHHLNIIRDGGRSEYFRQFVTQNPQGIVLAPYNATVQKYNEEGLRQQNGEEYLFTAKVTGNVKADDFNLETRINVKNGCKIMYLVNSKNNNLVNGTLGTFVSHEDCHYIRVGDVDYALKPVEFTKKEYVLNEKQDELELKEVGSIEQYPFKLAYALTIHKAQGLTFPEVTIDLTRPCFQKAQMYVAISRVTSPEGLRIIV